MPSLADVVAQLDARRRPLSAAACLNPECGNQCSYPSQAQGRRPLFCSSRCAKRYSAQRNQLIADLKLIDDGLEQTSARSKIGIHLQQQRAHVSWLLARYGGEPADDRQFPS